MTYKKGKMGVTYISRLCDFPKKEFFNRLYKYFWKAFSEKLSKKEI